MKKGLANYFGTGVQVAPPSLAGTPSDAAGKRQGGEDKTPNSKEGEGRRMPTSRLKTPTVRTHTNSHQRRAEEDKQGEETADFPDEAKRLDRTMTRPHPTNPEKANQ